MLMQPNDNWICVSDLHLQVCMLKGITVFLGRLHTFSERMPLHKQILNKTHTPQFSCKMKLYIQNNVISAQNCILFSNNMHKPSYKNQLNTDMLNGKHFFSIHFCFVQCYT